MILYILYFYYSFLILKGQSHEIMCKLWIQGGLLGSKELPQIDFNFFMLPY